MPMVNACITHGRVEMKRQRERNHAPVYVQQFHVSKLMITMHRNNPLKDERIKKKHVNACCLFHWCVVLQIRPIPFERRLLVIQIEYMYKGESETNGCVMCANRARTLAWST